MAMVGVLGGIPTLVRVDGTLPIWDFWPDWVPFLWFALFFLGGMRTAYGLKKDDRQQIAAGSCTVAWMTGAHGLATLIHTDGLFGWVITMVSVIMIILSGARSIHLNAIATELNRRVT